MSIDATAHSQPATFKPAVDLLDLSETRAALRGISRTLLYSLIESGDLHRVKLGSRAFITADSVNAYLLRQVEAGAMDGAA